MELDGQNLIVFNNNNNNDDDDDDDKEITIPPRLVTYSVAACTTHKFSVTNVNKSVINCHLYVNVLRAN